MADQGVLVVEDDPRVGRLICALLEGHGIDSHLVTDGLEALESMKDHTPGLVVLDLALPRIDGWEVLTTLQQAGREVPVVIVTAHGQGDGAKRARELGAARFLEKPFEPTQLVAAVEELLEGSVD